MMETAIGVFDSRDQAEKAVKELRVRGVPDNSIVFMSRSETDANSIAKEFGAYIGGFVGGAAGMTTGAVAASLLLPGLGPIFALGFGAAALLGLAGAGAGAKAGEASAHDENAPATASAESTGDVAFFRDALSEGRSIIVVRSKSPEISKLACEVLDRLGMSLPAHSSQVKMQTDTRQVGDVTVVDVSGRITLGEGNVMLREIVREMAARGNKKLVLNLREVHYLDSSGVGELVRTHTTVKNLDGQLRLASLSKRVSDLLEMTRLASVFDIEKDEDSAIRSLNGDAPRQAVA
jgi:anti-sigma B factor antagonist